MTSARDQQIRALYRAALERPPAERASFVAELSGGDEHVHRSVERLLSEQAAATDIGASNAAPSAEAAELPPGTVLAHYRLEGVLGRGGIGTVYRATDTKLNRPVAIKFLTAAVADDDAQRRFKQEAETASALNHPHIVTVYDIGEADGIAFLAMEYVEGKTLDRLIPPGGLPLQPALDYAIQIADTLSAAHTAGIVHRDVKPGNIMVTDAGVLKVLDFGLAKHLGSPTSPGDSATSETTHTRSRMIAGTPSFMSPEQAEGRPVDARSDVFSFGAVLYQMASGKRPFPGESALAAMAAVLHKEPDPLPASVPAEMQRVIARCLRKDPQRRFQHMDDLRVALEELRDEETLKSKPPATEPRRRKLLAAAVLALAATGAAAFWAFTRLANERPAAPGTLQPMQLTTSPWLAMGASLSPDERYFAFSSDRTGRFEVYIRPASPKGPERQITSDGQQNIEPSWSPDGKTIAYHSVAGHGIWVVPASGGTARQLAPFGSRPAWSPDGRRLAFRSMEPNDLAWFDWAGTGESTIFTVDAAGSNLHRVTMAHNPDGQHADPVWTPDGRRLLFASLGPMGARASINTLWLVDAESGALQRVAGGNLLDQASPVLSPDGRTVYFSAMAADGFGLYSAPLAGNAPPTALYRSGRDAPAALSISRNGRRLFFTLLTNVSQIWQTGTGSSPAKPLYQDEVVRAKLPAYSPDGRRLAYLVQPQSATQDLWMMNADGSNATVIVSDRGYANGPGWSHDSGSIWFSFAAASSFQVRRFQVSDGSQQVVMETREYFTRAHLMPNERELIYDAGRPTNVWVRSLASGISRQLTFDRESASFPVISWDGQWIAYELTRGDATELAVMDRNGGHQEVIAGAPGVHYAYSFASDNRRIAYTSSPGGVWNVYWIDRITRKIEQVTHYTAFGSVVRSPAWRPGTEQMAFELTEVKGNVHSVELPGDGLTVSTGAVH